MKSALNVMWRLMLAISMLSLSIYGENMAKGKHYGLAVDWSHRFMVSHAQLADSDFQTAAISEPRVLYNWMVRHPARNQRRPSHNQLAQTRASEQVDWHFPLGIGTVSRGMYPAKFSFSLSQAPDCTNDVVVYGLNVAGALFQPNLVGLNNLYVNATNTGTCTGTAPGVAFAYNVTTVGNGSVVTSPSFSLDGTKVAFIETVTSGSGSVDGQPCTAPCSIFHVLTLGTGAGNGSFLANTYVAAVPGIGNNAGMTSLVYSNAGTTRSSPYIDYHNDVAYFGDDNGNLYQVTCVFQTSCVPALASGYSIGSGIAVVSSGTNRILTAPLYDSNANKIIVGASDGNVYIISLANCAGNPITCSGTTSLAVGKPAGAAGCFAGYSGIADPPLVDSTFQVWFAATGCNGVNKAAVVEGDYAGVTQGLGISMGSGAYDEHAGMFDDNYFNTSLNDTSVAGNAYFVGPNPSKQLVLFGATMVPKNGVGTALSSSNPPIVSNQSTMNLPGHGISEASPITVVQNGNVDWLFFGQQSVPKNGCNNSVAAEGCIYSVNVFNGAGVSTIPTAITAQTSEASGTSGIVVDNVSGSAAGSNIYFANQAATSTSAAPVCTIGFGIPAYCAVKLTQSALQ